MEITLYLYVIRKMPMNNKNWISETNFGKWFLSTNVWYKYVLQQAIIDFQKMLGEYGNLNFKYVLDAGCGQGLAFNLLLKHLKASSIIGLDIDFNLITKTNTKLNSECHIVNADAHAIPLHDASIDAIFCHQLLHHCEYQDAILREFYRVLKPNGFLFVGESCKIFIESFFVRLLFNHPSQQYSAREYIDMLKKNSFEIITNGVKTHTPFWSTYDYGLLNKIGLKRKRIKSPSEVLIIAKK